MDEEAVERNTDVPAWLSLNDIAFMVGGNGRFSSRGWSYGCHGNEGFDTMKETTGMPEWSNILIIDHWFQGIFIYIHRLITEE